MCYACVLSHFSHVHLFATLWTIVHQAPLSMEILQARILEWVALPSSRESSHPGIETRSPASPALAGRFFTISTTPLFMCYTLMINNSNEHEVGLKVNIQKTKIMVSGPITSWQIDGETVETVSDFIWGAQKSLQMMIAVIKLKDTYSLEGKLWPT